MSQMPPQALDVEESLLCSVLMHNNSLNEISFLKPSDFYRTAHATIYGAMLDMFKINEPIDLATITDCLRSKKKLESIGGAIFLAKMLDTIPIAQNPESYAKIVKDKSVKRKLIEIANNLTNKAFDDSISTVDVLNEAQREVLSVEATGNGSDMVMLGDAITETVERLNYLQTLNTNISGVPSGYESLDRITSGFQNSDLIIIAARPGAGKTALAINILDNVVSNGGKAAIFSLEMPRVQLVNRILSRHTGINGNRFKSSGFNAEEWKKINESAGYLYEKNLIINDNPDMNYMDVRREARKYKKMHGIQLVVIDYLQIMSGDRGFSREQEVSSIARNMKSMAKELNIPVIGLAQLNRGLEQRGDKRPVLSDLRESGSLEQESDIVAFIYRDELYNKDENNPHKGTAEINIAKHRNGMTGNIELKFKKELTLFHEPTTV